MNSLKTEAIILKGFKYGDSSKIITLFSEEIGKFSAIVKGVRSSKSKFGGVFENMNLVKVIFNRKDNRDLQLISNADCISSFSNIKENFEKLLIAYKILELTSKMMFEYDKSKEVFLLLKNSFKILENAESNFDVLFLLFQMKFALIQGINPINEDSGNFESQNFVYDYDGSAMYKYKNDMNINSIILNLMANEIDNFANISIKKEDVSKLQNAYDLHFMNCSGKYGYSKNKLVIDELNKKLNYR